MAAANTAKLLLCVAMMMGPAAPVRAEPVAALEAAPAAAAQLGPLAATALAAADDLAARRAYDKAEALLRALLADARLNDIERATTWRSLAHIHAAQQHYDAAIDALLDSLEGADPDRGVGPPRAHIAETLATLGGYFVLTDQYAKAIDVLEGQRDIFGMTRASDTALLGLTYRRAERHDNAIAAYRAAIAASPGPREDWHGILLELYLARDRNLDALGLLNDMVTRWPQNRYYCQMRTCAARLVGLDEKALAAMPPCESAMPSRPLQRPLHKLFPPGIEDLQRVPVPERHGTKA
ncbi:MAG: tetratricopeptide repeat protein [Rhodospirillaceae bacterium]|nr:tetratricopeptide repeat protein [Rhodospirillaceae bacterium]